MNLPTGWKRLALTDVADFLDQKRVPLEKTKRESFSGPYPYYGASGVIDHVAEFIFDGDFVLLAEDGANILNRSTPIAFKANGRFWVNNHAHVLRPKSGIDHDFLTEYLESLNFERFNTGTTQPKLNRQVCEQIPVIVPLPTEQKRLGELSVAWGTAIQKTEQLIAAKERHRDALIQRLYALSNSRGKASRFCEFLYESMEPGSSGRHAKKITVKLYGKGVLAKEEKRQGSEQTQYFIRRAGQLIYSKLDFLNGAFGIVPPELDGYESTLDLPAFDIASTVNPIWLLGYLTRPTYYTHQVGLARGQRKARRVHPSDLLASSFHVPPRDLQDRIAEILASSQDDIDKSKRLLQSLKTQKRGLMQKLLTGQWRLPIPDNAEEAANA